MEERPICPKCDKRPVDFHASGWRKMCWSCRCDRPKHNQRIKEAAKKLKLEVLNNYGGKCQCCGETEPAFLSLDHINNDGAEHRKVHGRGCRIHRWAKKNGYPNSLRLLCHNCNLGRYINGGICPHQK